MECQDVRVLLAFTERPCEAVDAAERTAVARHLQVCADCTAFAQGQRALDEALGPVLRDVPVPADLKPKVMKRLSASRGPRRWKGAVAAAAGLLLALAGGLSYHFYSSRIEVTDDDLGQIVAQDRWQGGNADDAQRYLRNRGYSVDLPQEFNYEFLRAIEILDFKGCRVAKLGFAGNGALADILILPDKQFRTKIDATNVADWDVQTHHEGNCSFLIFFRGQLDALRTPPA